MPQRKPALTLVEILVVIGILGLLVALLLPATRSAREPARRNTCRNNLKQIGLALHNYAEAEGTLPPAYTVDAEGNRLHSWRTLLLPYLEQSQLFETIDLTKPWDDPANSKARETAVAVYQCPSSPEPDGLSHCLAVVGEDCLFSESGSRKFSDVSDSPSETILVVEVATDRAVHWMAPQDTHLEELLAHGPESRTNHPGMMHAIFADGHVHSLSLDIDKPTLRAMLTIAGGEKLPDF
jgi:prepilin-type processing-associated H-X9-DG protein